MDDLSKEDWQLIKRLRRYHNGSYAKVIDKLITSAQPMRKKGKWIDMDDHVMCSCCGATHYGTDKNYCPNCGADMREGEADG